MLALLAGASASMAVPRSAGAQQLTKLRVAGALSDPFGEPFFAQAAGAFKRSGFELEVQNLANAPVIEAAIGGGSLDMGTGDLISGVNAILKGVPIQLVVGSAVYNSTEPSSILAIAKDGPIRGPRDLNGKTIALPSLVGMATAAVRNWLPQNGVDASTVRFVELSQAASVPALQHGTIDCALLAEPFVTPSRDLIRDMGHPYDAIAKEYAQSVWYMATSWIEADRERARSVVNAILETGRWCNSHRTETFAILVNDAHLDGEKLKGMKRTTFATSPLTPELVQPVLTAGYNAKIFDRLIDARQLIAKI
jgi:NitT/TauT family transport system substrate-binding protein